MMYDILNTAFDTGRILHLVSAHAKEMYGEEGNLDLNHFFTIANAGLARVYVARDEKVIVGYATFLLHRDLFKAHVRQAECVAVYVMPGYRGTFIAKRLLQFAEKMLAEKDGATRLISTTSKDPRLQAFYERLGYCVSNVQVTKEL